MKYQLNPDQLKTFADTLRESHLSVEHFNGREAAAEGVFNAFLTAKHDPFTRKDFNAVLDALGYSTDGADTTLDATFFALVSKMGDRVKGQRGYYTFNAVDPEPVEEELLQTPEPVVVETVEGTSWVPDRVTPENEGYYGSDVGLRRMAIGESSCYGNWSPKADPCGHCPLAGFCSVASMADIADIAADLDRETEKAILDANKPPVTTPTPVPSVETLRPAASQEPVYPEGSHIMEVPFEGICTKCGSSIPEGALGIHIPGKGMLHPDCGRIN